VTTVKKNEGTDGAGGAPGPERTPQSGVKAQPGKGGKQGLSDGAGGAPGPERIEESGVNAEPGKGGKQGQDDGAGGAPGPERIKESGIASTDKPEGMEKADLEREEIRQEVFLDRLDASEDRKAFLEEQRIATQDLDRKQAGLEKNLREQDRKADNARTETIKEEEPGISGPAAMAQATPSIEEAKRKALGDEEYEGPNTNKPHKRVEVPDIHGKEEYVDPKGVDTDLRYADPIDQGTRTAKNQKAEAEDVLKRPKDEDLNDDDREVRRQGFRGVDEVKPSERRESHAANPDHGGISAGLGQEDPDQSSVNSIATPESVPPSDISFVEPATNPSMKPRQDRGEDPKKDPTAPPYTPDTGVPA
jgi:hypothetical protein